MKVRLKLIFLNIFLIAVSYYAIIFLLFHFQFQKTPLIKYVQNGILLDKGIFQRSSSEIDTIVKVDILFFGSSHAYRAFDPNVFKKYGFSSYNLGSSSQSPLNSYFLMKKYIQKCNTVILEVYPVAFSINGAESFADLVRAEPNYFNLFFHAAAITQVMPFQNISVKPFSDNYIKGQKEDFCIYRQGYVEVYDSAGKKNIAYPQVTLNEKLMDKQFKYLKKIISLCDSQNKELILVYAPVPSKHQMVNEVYYKKSLHQITEEHKIPFFDMSRSLPLSDSNHFFDDDHMNAAGVAIFNQYLSIALKQHLGPKINK
jgi:hypothetical protein